MRLILAIRLASAFFMRPALDVAQALIGKRLVYIARGERRSGRIVETEAYVGTDDPASHAFGGRRGANESMYGAPGTVYVYFTYGNHYMLNLVVGASDYPAAILIRGATAEEGLPGMRRRRKTPSDHLLARGPGNLCRAFGIDKKLDGIDLFGPRIWIEHTRLNGRVKTSGRIGIGNRGAQRRWRFYLAGHPSVSGPRHLSR